MSIDLKVILVYFLFTIVLINIVPILSFEIEVIYQYFILIFYVAFIMSVYMYWKYVYIYVFSTNKLSSQIPIPTIARALFTYFKKLFPLFIFILSVTAAYIASMMYIVFNGLFNMYLLFASSVFIIDFIAIYIISPYILFNKLTQPKLFRIHRLVILVSIPWVIIAVLTITIIDTFISTIGGPTTIYPYIFPWSEGNIEILRNYGTIPLPSIGNIVSAIPIAYYTRYVIQKFCRKVPRQSIV